METTALFALLGGCGSDDEGGKITESPNLGASAEKLISASAGGLVILPEAGVKLEIPAGALSADTMIKAEVISKLELTEAAQLAGNVVEFGPHGLTFEVPATLELDLGTAQIPADAKVSLAYFNDSTKKWEDLAGSVRAGTRVLAQTSHFSVFAIRFAVANNSQVIPEASVCKSEYSACGGDITGDWRVTSGCADTAALFGGTESECKGASVTLGMNVTGDVTFGSGRISGTMSMTTEFTQLMPKSCIGGSCPSSASEGAQFVDKGTTCESKQRDTESNEVDEQYRVEGSRLIIVDSETGEEDNNTSYCVSGNTLVVNTATKEGFTLRWTATRK